jgi:RES domain-containing protein
MLQHSDLIAALKSVPRITIHGPWSRCIEYALTKGPPPGRAPGSPAGPLWPGGAVLSGARFTPRGSFSTLYLASDKVTALIEIGSIFSHAGLVSTTIATNPAVVFAVDGVLTDVVDLTDEAIQKAIGTSTQELTGAWRLSPSSPTHECGQAAFDCGVITALKFPSSKHAGAWCLAIFTDRLTLNPANFVEVVDSTSSLAQRLP